MCMAPTFKASEEGKTKIDTALEAKRWKKGDDSEAIPAVGCSLVLSGFHEKNWNGETRLNRRQLENCKLFDQDSLDQIFSVYKSRTYNEEIKHKIQSGELKVKGISSGTWRRFLSKKLIKPKSFKACCEVLGLNWEEIKEDSPPSDRKKPIETDTQSCRGSEVSDRTLALVEEYTQLFVGREDVLSELDKFLTQTDKRYLTITAPAGFGKTALLANWVKSRQRNDYFIACHFFRQLDEITCSVANAYRNLLEQIYNYREVSKVLSYDKNQLQEELYQVVKTWKSQSLVIVIDGLDEAERPFLPRFPTALPPNVFIIASARKFEEEERDYFSGWTNNEKHICLNHLTKEAIADWLRETGKSELVSLAQDETFVAQVCDRTERIPLFLKYLIDELVEVAQQGEESAIRKTLEATPKGFPEYIRQQYQALDRLEDWHSRRDLRKIFYFLTIAKGELSSDDLVKLMGESPVGLPWRVRRWFKIRLLEDCLVYSFAHSTLAEQFAVLPEIKANTKKSQKELIQYCAQWEEHQSHYALRHYPEHLSQTEKWDELYELARNKTFAATQQKHLPDEPNLSLKTVQTALLGAAETDNVTGMAEFMLVHARRLVQTTEQDSPLDALRSGSLQRALTLADLYEIERRVLWYLLLAWELKDEGKENEAREILDRLLKKKLPQLFNWNAEYAACLLPPVLDLSKNAFTNLHQKLVSDNKAYYVLCEHLSIHNHADLAIETVQKIDSKWEQVKTLSKIAAIQARAGGKPKARNLLDSAFMKAKEIDHPFGQVLALRAIAKAEAQSEDFIAAQKTVQEIHDQANKAVALGEIAVLMAQSKQHEKIDLAVETLVQALNILEAIGDGPQHTWAKWSLVECQALIGDLSGALQAIQTIGKIQDKSIAKAHKLQQNTAKITIYDVLKTAHEIGNKVLQQQMIEVIALVQVCSGDFTGAIETMQTIEHRLALGWLFKKIALEKTKSKDFTGALETIQNIDRESILIETLKNIAKAQVYANQQKAARTTLAMALREKPTHQAIRQKTFQAIAMAQAREFDLAKEIAFTIEYDRAQAFAFRAIAVVQAEEGQVKAALQTIQNIPSYVFPWNSEQGWALNIYSERVLALREIALVCIQLETKNKWENEGAQPTLEFALDILQKITQRHINCYLRQAPALETILVTEAGIKNITRALDIARTINDEAEQVEVFWVITSLQVQQGDRLGALDTLLLAREKALVIEHQVQKCRLLSNIAVTQAKLRDFPTALATLQFMSDQSFQALALQTLAVLQIQSGFASQALKTADIIPIIRHWHLPEIAAAFVEIGDKANFKKLLIPCAYYLDAAYRMCGHLAKLYQQQASAVAKVLSELN